MSTIAIKVENLGKSYRVGHNTAQSERYTALRDVLARNAKNLARKTRDMFQGKDIIQGDEIEEFWALKDINFEIKQGERVGIIGRNGAGKSTLLKILSRITEPTTGRVRITGRVASLLEVGTGFHPELTGRENVFLNGAILGMSRKEIQRKFDEIVDFAEVERFLDTPVKRYSSGMYVRLAFAVAAHLEPEILVVDEVLAVGDAQFQKKCLGKMEEVSKGGRTVLFVSHNMAAIKSLCKKTILLSTGKLHRFDCTDKVISHYYQSAEIRSNEKIKVLTNFENENSFWKIGERALISIENDGVEDSLLIDIAFYDENRIKLFSIEGSKFHKPLTIGRGVKLKVKNPGIINTTVFVDIGLKKHLLSSYDHLITNVTEIKTEYLQPSSPINGKLLPTVDVCRSHLKNTSA